MRYEFSCLYVCSLFYNNVIYFNYQMNYYINPPKIIRKVLASSQWQSKTDKILFTVDDSPNAGITEQILDKFDEYRIRGVFFCVGEKVKKEASLVNEILQRGHIIGGHGFTHSSFLLKNRAFIKDEIEKTEKVIHDVVGYDIKYFRPPYGRLNFSYNGIIKGKGIRNIMWTLLINDYKKDLNLVKFVIKKFLRKDSIIVLHDNKKSKEISEMTIDLLVKEIKIKGYEIGEPEECLK